MESLDHLVGGLTSELDTRLAAVDALLAARYPGERAGRQPVHTVYVPADRFHPGLVGDHRAAALLALDEHEDRLVGLVDGDRGLVARVRAKLGREPVEDLRIDFEDGYGTRSDEEEDGDVRARGCRPARRARRRDRRPLHRHPVQGVRGAHPAAAACARSRSSWPGSPRTAPCRRPSSSRCPR